MAIDSFETVTTMMDETWMVWREWWLWWKRGEGGAGDVGIKAGGGEIGQQRWTDAGSVDAEEKGEEKRTR